MTRAAAVILALVLVVCPCLAAQYTLSSNSRLVIDGRSGNALTDAVLVVSDPGAMSVSNTSLLIANVRPSVTLLLSNNGVTLSVVNITIMNCSDVTSVSIGAATTLGLIFVEAFVVNVSVDSCSGCEISATRSSFVSSSDNDFVISLEVLVSSSLFISDCIIQANQSLINSNVINGGSTVSIANSTLVANATAAIQFSTVDNVTLSLSNVTVSVLYLVGLEYVSAVYFESATLLAFTMTDSTVNTTATSLQLAFLANLSTAFAASVYFWKAVVSSDIVIARCVLVNTMLGPSGLVPSTSSAVQSIAVYVMHGANDTNIAMSASNVTSTAGIAGVVSFSTPSSSYGVTLTVADCVAELIGVPSGGGSLTPPLVFAASVLNVVGCSNCSVVVERTTTTSFFLSQLLYTPILSVGVCVLRIGQLVNCVAAVRDCSMSAVSEVVALVSYAALITLFPPSDSISALQEALIYNTSLLISGTSSSIEVAAGGSLAAISGPATAIDSTWIVANSTITCAAPSGVSTVVFGNSTAYRLQIFVTSTVGVSTITTGLTFEPTYICGSAVFSDSNISHFVLEVENCTLLIVGTLASSHTGASFLVSDSTVTDSSLVFRDTTLTSTPLHATILVDALSRMVSTNLTITNVVVTAPSQATSDFAVHPIVVNGTVADSVWSLSNNSWLGVPPLVAVHPSWNASSTLAVASCSDRSTLNGRRLTPKQYGVPSAFIRVEGGAVPASCLAGEGSRTIHPTVSRSQSSSQVQEAEIEAVNVPLAAAATAFSQLSVAATTASAVGGGAFSAFIQASAVASEMACASPAVKSGTSFLRYSLSPFDSNVAMVLGNIGIAVGVAALQLLAATGSYYWRQPFRDRRFALALSQISFPGFAVSVASFLAPGVLFASILLFRDGTAGVDMLVAIVGSLCVAALLGVYVAIIFRFSKKARFVLYSIFRWRRRPALWAFPTGYWAPAVARKMYSGVFGSCHAGARVWCVVPLCNVVAFDVVASVSAGSYCWLQFTILGLIELFLAVGFAYNQPLRVPLATGLTVSSLLCLSAAMFCGAVQSGTGAAWADTGSIVSSMLQSLLVVVQVVHAAWRNVCERCYWRLDRETKKTATTPKAIRQANAAEQRRVTQRTVRRMSRAVDELRRWTRVVHDRLALVREGRERDGPDEKACLVALVNMCCLSRRLDAEVPKT